MKKLERIPAVFTLVFAASKMRADMLPTGMRPIDQTQSVIKVPAPGSASLTLAGGRTGRVSLVFHRGWRCNS